MQTGQLLSSMFNRIASTTPKQIDLTPGQVFKGTVTKLYPDNMAQVQIGGVQVLAKLEANLEVGQKAWLQVQPTANPVTLKVLTSPDNPQQLQDPSVEGLMRSMGLNDTQETRAIVESLVKQNLPVTKETVNAFTEVAKTQGASKEVVDAFLLAMRRNLPLTNDVVASLKTFLSGKPLADSINQFLREAEAFMKSADQPESTESSSVDDSQASSNIAILRQLVSRAAGKVAGIPVQLTGLEQQPVNASELLTEKGTGTSNAQRFTPGTTPDNIIRGAQGNPQGAAQAAVQGTNQAAVQAATQATANLTDQMSSRVALSGAGSEFMKAVQSQLASDSIPLSNMATQQSVGASTNTFASSSASAPGTNAGQPTNEPQLTGGIASGRVFSPEQNATVNAKDVSVGSAANQVPQTQTSQNMTAMKGQQPEQGLQAQLALHAQGQQTPQGQQALQHPQAEQIQSADPKAGQQPFLPSSTTEWQMNQSMTGSQPGETSTSMQAGRNPNSLLADNTDFSSFQLADRSNLNSSAAKPLLLKELFQQLGVSHERHMALPRLGAGEIANTQMHLDNVKSMLMQISQSAGQVPDSLKEAADTLLQQVTGQQLLLTQPSHQAISQVVMQIPLRTDEGNTTVFVQIESKKQEGGQLDAENCRLFFNLDLHALGITMVDVNIVNKIVNINIYNNLPMVEGLVAHARESFSSQLREAGYQLSHLKTQPIPQHKSMAAQVTSNGQLSSSYKGVDLRI